MIDDLSTGVAGNLPPGVELIRADICDPAAVAAALEGVDGVFHLAAIASVERCIREWKRTSEVNLGGTISILDGVKRTGGSIRVVYASSAAVYGESEASPIGEGAEKRPLSSYGVDKLASELHARVATRTHGIPTVGLRFFNVYGPRQDPHSPFSGVISIFVDRLRRNQTITIFGDGQQTRDFVFVADVVAALVQAMTAPVQEAEVLNICTGRAITVVELAKLVAELLGVQLNIHWDLPRKADIRHSVGSPLAGRTRLDLSEPTSLRAGLSRLIAETSIPSRSMKQPMRNQAD